jgi:GxxExxY protein
MDEEENISVVLHESINIHKKIGPGMLETVYKTCLAYKLQQRGLHVEAEKSVPVVFE